MSAARILVATTLGIVLIAPSVFAGNLEQKGGQQAVKVEQLPPTVTAAVAAASTSPPALAHREPSVSARPLPLPGRA